MVPYPSTLWQKFIFTCINASASVDFIPQDAYQGSAPEPRWGLPSLGPLTDLPRLCLVIPRILDWPIALRGRLDHKSGCVKWPKRTVWNRLIVSCIVVFWWRRQQRHWILQRWDVQAPLPWQWRHRDAECSLRSDENRTMHYEKSRTWADVARSAISRMFCKRSRHRQQSLFRPERMFTARCWSKLRQHKALLRYYENALRSCIYVHQR